MTDDDAWGALAELVRLKDVKDYAEELGVEEMPEGYRRAKPLAWQRARDALARHQAHLAEVEAGRACPECGHPKADHHKRLGCLDGWGGGRTGGCRCADTPEAWEFHDLLQALRGRPSVIVLPR